MYTNWAVPLARFKDEGLAGGPCGPVLRSLRLSSVGAGTAHQGFAAAPPATGGP
jgi:hypothetical protein